MNQVPGGNPALSPEKADTLTAGVVFTPASVPGLSFSIDYYEIDIKDAISTIAATDGTVQRACDASNGTSPLCDLFTRPLPFSDRSPANFPTQIRITSLNVASLKQSGIDAEINYRFEVAGGMLSLRGLASHVIKQDTQQFEGAPIIKWGGTAPTPPPPVLSGFGVPHWRLTAFARFELDRLTFDVQQRWRNSMRQNGDAALVYAEPKVPAVGYTDVTVTYLFNRSRNLTGFVSIENFFDKESPPFITNNYGSVPGFYYPVANGDDIMGRYITGGLRMRF